MLTPRGLLPTALVVLFCAFFVLAFGFRFGADVARAYMISAAVSFVLGGLVVQPLSILLFSSIRYRLFRAFVTQHVRGSSTPRRVVL